MIHRVLRSWWLYPLLLVVVVVVYATSGTPKIDRTPLPASPTMIQDPLALWPKELDKDVLMRVIGERPVLGWLLFMLIGAIGGLFFGGIAISIYDLVTGRGRTWWRATSDPLPPWTLGQAWRIFALTLFMALLLPLVPALWGMQLKSEAFVAMVAMLGLDLFVLVTVLGFAQGNGVTARRLFLGGRPTAAALAASFRQYVSAFPWLFLLLFLIVRISKLLNIHIPPEEIQKLLFSGQEPGVLAMVMVLACVVAPVAEELFFRGVIFGALRHRSSRWVALLGSGAAFALVHTNPVGFLSIMALGCVLADMYDRTGMLLAPITVHIVHNTLLMGLAMTFRQLLLSAS